MVFRNTFSTNTELGGTCQGAAGIRTAHFSSTYHICSILSQNHGAFVPGTPEDPSQPLATIPEGLP